MANQRRLARTTVPLDDLHEKWMESPDYRREHEALEAEFRELAELARLKAKYEP